MAKNNTGLLNNLIWKFAERISAQLITTIVAVILARRLDPTDYGVISIVTIFITLANVFVSSGFGNALVQKKDADLLDYCSVLYTTVGMAILMYLVLFFCAPYVSAFYGEGYEILTPVLRVLSLRLILSAVNSVQHAYVSKQMMFRKFFLATIIGTIVSAVVGIAMAYSGFGVWALVAQYLTNTTVNTITLKISMKLKFPFEISFERLKSLLSYGWKILGGSLLITGYQELRALIIGKLYSSADLAFYDKGKQFPGLIVSNIDASITAVLFPKMSNEQDNIDKLKSRTRQSIRFSSFVMCPMMLGLFSIAPTFVRVILTEKWIECVPLLQCFCIVYLFQPIHSANIQAIKALGRSDIYLKLEIIKKSIELVTLLAVMWISVEAIAINMAVLTTLFTFVNSYHNIKLLNYKFSEQIHDIIFPIIMSIIMGAAVFATGLIDIPDLPLMILQIVVGMISYTLLSVLSRNEEFLFIKNFVMSKLKVKR